ncbi:MAG: hypothetical protein SOX84_05030, partial [Prevotella sp.]|nr:hypothetical protein [Prevotella sp.]
MKTKRWTYTLIGIVVAVGIYSFRGAKILNKNKHSHPTYSEFKGRAGQQGNAEEAAESTMQYGGKAIELPAFVQNARYPEQILHRTGYTVSYNSVTKLPNWVSWQLKADKTDGENERNYSAIIGRYRICQFIKPQIRLESHDKKFCCASWLFQRPNEVRGKRP